MRGKSKILGLLLLLCSATALVAQQDVQHLNNLQAGQAINVFSNYGYLYLGLHVLPTKRPGPWLIMEDTYDLFEDEPGRKTTLAHKGDLLLDFCSTAQQLVKAYFRNFTIEGFPKAYKSFTSSWDKSRLAKSMGIADQYVNGKYSYVLVRLIKKTTLGWTKMDDYLRLNNRTVEQVNLVTPGDEISVEGFLDQVGTHYISSFVTGDIVYQVFVYGPKKYAKIREMRNQQNISRWTQDDMDLVFSPSFAEHIGKVKVVSENETAKEWVKQNINYKFFTYKYENLLKLYRHSRLKYKLLNLLGDEAICHLELKTLVPVFRNNETRSWFEEILTNRLILWDSTM